MFRFNTLPDGRAQRASCTYNNTFYTLMAALLWLLPQFVTGQCTTLVCAQNVQFSLGNDCTGSVNPVNMLANYWSCQGPLTLSYYDAGGNPLGPTLTSAQLGQTVNVHVKHTWTGLTCWGTVYVKDGKKPTLSTANLTLNCTGDTSATALDPPLVTDNCSASSHISLSHQDTVLDFGCGYDGFAGYFDPSNWTVCTTNNGDGGVDVTGAPNSVLVEGANSSPISSTASYVTRFKIVIPTEGFVSFDWSSFGGSSFSNEGIYLTINNWCIRLSNDTTQMGSYTTGILHPGDVLSFEQTSNGSANANSTLFSNFHFSTLAWKVIQRKWMATDEWGNTATQVQTITLTRTQLSQVHFPPNRDGIQAPMLPCGANASDPSVTGIPFVDEDGNLATTVDQYVVNDGDCFFNLTYTDQVVPTCGGSLLILRTWTVLDNCTSQSVEHTQLIKLFDITPPTINCPPATTVSTDAFTCSATVSLPSATAVDDCSAPVSIVPSWSFGSGFGAFGNVPIGTHTVTYDASDACGNTSQCTTTITVQDLVSPTAICVQSTVAAIASTGEATVYADLLDAGSNDNCCIQDFMVKRAGQPNSAFAPSLTVSCADLANSTVAVTLRVLDCHGNANTCDVTVDVHDELPPVIVPPTDVLVDCNTDLSNLSLFGQPLVSDNCSVTLSESSVTDLNTCGQGTVTRIFTATDPGGNMATAQQVIHLVNQTPWNASSNQIVWPQDYQSQACSGESLEPFDLPYPFSGPSLSGQNGCSNLAVNFEDAIFWISEPACYRIERTWTVLDWCQYQPNSSSQVGLWTHVQKIEVVDNQPPVFVNAPTSITVSGCAGSLTLQIPQVQDCSNHVTITASGALGSGFSFQNVSPGIYPMTFTASDGCGNLAAHDFTVTVSACNGSISLGGMVQTPSGAPVGQVTVSLAGAAVAPVTTLAGVGNFSFIGLPSGGDYTLTPSKNIGFVNGVTAFDLAKINEHILAVTPFTQAWQIIAADANGSGTVTASDLVAIQSVILSNSPNFPNGVPSWRFVPSNYVFPDPAHPFPFPQTLSLNDVVQDNLGAGFLAIKTGDVSGNANPAFIVGSSTVGSSTVVPEYSGAVGNRPWRASPSADWQSVTEGRSAGFFNITTKDLSLRKGEVTEVLFEMATAPAWQFTLAFDTKLVEFQGFAEEMEVVGQPRFNTSQSKEGVISMLCFGQQPATHFILKLKALADGKLADALNITSDLTPAAAWNRQGEQLEPVLNFEDASGQAGLDLMARCQPNPFSQQATIRFNLPQTGEVVFRFFDAEGRQVHALSGQFGKGENSISVNAGDLGTTGLVFLKIKTGSTTLTQRLVVLP